MLIRFTVENFLSFKNETEFNMLTGDIRRHPNHVYSHPKIDLVKSAVIYGANGAGKSNLIQAIYLLSLIVTEGSIGLLEDDFKFKLSNETSETATLEVEFISENKGYAYGINFDGDRIVEEWLYILNFGIKEDSLVFKRESLQDGKAKITLADKYLKTNKDRVLIQVYEEDLLEHQVPFIFLAKDKKFKEITAAYKWIEKSLIIINPEMKLASLAYNFIEDNNFKSFTNQLICKFDTGIEELEIETMNFDLYFGEDNKTEKDRILKQLKSGERELVGDHKNALAMMEDNKPVIKKVVSYHLKPSGEKVKFELFNESAGTLRMIDFVPVLYLLEKYPITIIIDEIDQSIHPSLLKEFIAFVQSNPNKMGQLIFSTHESNLLDFDLFRQDEIWFAEKDTEKATCLYPLSEYNVRTDLDVRKGYLSGRFGAIPFLGDFKKLKD